MKRSGTNAEFRCAVDVDVVERMPNEVDIEFTKFNGTKLVMVLENKLKNKLIKLLQKTKTEFDKQR